ncbi:MAG: ATP-grasp domain-containing protein [Bacteroidales bacterium]|nr:ATP-grasp domain-containing protein [Clostridium sp.]MCM1203849.1 ATP-grasp domain-containing protein [Bacteroidales bacterium]
MKTTGLVIGAGRDAIHVILLAQKQGIYVIALDGNAEAEGMQYADKAVMVDISDMDAVHKVIEEIHPDLVLPVPIGRYLITTGYVNEKFGLRGVKRRATELSTDKYLFHSVLQEQNLRPIESFLVNSEIKPQPDAMKYPAILKPRFGSGSREVFFVNNEEETKKVYQKIAAGDEDFVFEEAVDGIEYGVDGVVINGKFYLVLLRKKVLTPLPVRQAIASFSVIKNEKNKELWDDVNACMEKVVWTLDYDDCLVNADIIVNENGVFVIEIAPRPAGHNLQDKFIPLATGIDMEEEFIRFLLNGQANFEVQEIRCIQIRFFDFEDVRVKLIPGEEDLKRQCNLLAWDCRMQAEERLLKVVDGHSIINRGFFIVEGDNEEDLVRQSDWVLSQFQLERIEK